jgi:hypothetical protein
MRCTHLNGSGARLMIDGQRLCPVSRFDIQLSRFCINRFLEFSENAIYMINRSQLRSVYARCSLVNRMVNLSYAYE